MVARNPSTPVVTPIPVPGFDAETPQNEERRQASLMAVSNKSYLVPIAYYDTRPYNGPELYEAAPWFDNAQLWRGIS